MFDVTQNRRLTSENRPTNWSKKQPAKTGLQVNIDKTVVMKITSQQQKQQQHPASITINGRDLKEVTSFTYLALRIVSTTGGTDQDVKSNENREGEKHIHQPEINLEIFVTQPESTTKFSRIFNTN
uniref:Uncharacterized protein n=1 Tax=Trichobilharzia regenti TaxID=157069 RepID=A0AA85K7P0_TRIRE